MSIVVNGRRVEAEAGELLLDVLRRAGIDVPTLCHVEGLEATGACRLCAVEVEDETELVPSCNYPVRDDMVVRTHSPRAVRARRVIVELLLAAHPDDCLYCVRNLDCRLQELARELGVHGRRFLRSSFSGRVDASGPALIRDEDKCVLCSRCVRVCDELQTVTALDFAGRGKALSVDTCLGRGLNVSPCVACGQCVAACPTAAIHERLHLDAVVDALADPGRTVVVSLSPAAAVALGAVRGLKVGVDGRGRLAAAMGALGFDRVFDESAALDLLVREQAAEWAARLDAGREGPYVSTLSSAVERFVAASFPAAREALSAFKDPSRFAGALARAWLERIEGVDGRRLVMVTVTPCLSSKADCLPRGKGEGGDDVDLVLGLRELDMLFRMQGIDPFGLGERACDRPLVTGSAASRLFALPGAWADALCRALHHRLTGRELDERATRFLRGTSHVRTGRVVAGGRELSVAVVSGLGNLRTLFEEIDGGRERWDLVEALACPGGCLQGGTQLRAFGPAEMDGARRLLARMERDAARREAHLGPSLELFDEALLDGMSPSERARLLTRASGEPHGG